MAVFSGSHGNLVPSATPRYRRVEGTREEKLSALSSLPDALALGDVPFSLLRPMLGQHFPEDWISLPALMPFHGEGVQTNRDAALVADDPETLRRRLQTFALGLRAPELDALWKSSRHFDPEQARRAVQESLRTDPNGDSCVRPIFYRPFERRYFITHPALCHRPRPKLASAMAHSQFALLSVRKDRGDRPWTHLAACAEIPDNCALSARSSCRARAFPTHGPDGAPNLSPLARRLAPTWSGAEWLAYAAGVLCSPLYRSRHGGVLHLDYPALPPPSSLSEEQGLELRNRGRALIDAMLVEADTEKSQSTRSVGHFEIPVSSSLDEAFRAAERVADEILKG